MADKVSKEVRSRMMAAVKARNTGPERHVRAALFGDGFRYRLHRRDLPGNPDIVLPRYRTVVFVHGCFWHGHDCPRGLQRPQSRREFWNAKLDGNIARDRANQAALRDAGWTVFVIWTCQLEADTASVLAFLRQQRAARFGTPGSRLDGPRQIAGEERC